MKSLNIKYIPQLDHLRFFAAFLVILFHVSHNALTEKLHFEVGVDLFFTLSGFLFFIIAEESNKDILYGKFIYNRFLRIYPLVIVLFFLAIVVMRDHFTFIDYFNLFGLNLTGDGKITWIAGDWGYKYLSFNWWTIGVEFIFYLIFPLIFKFYKKNGIAFLLKLLVTIVVLRYGLYYIRVGEDGWKTLNIEINYSVFGHMDTFIAGMIMGYLYLRRSFMPNIQKILSSKIIFFGLLLCAQIFLFYSDNIDSLLYPTLIGFICGLLIISYISAFSSINNKISHGLTYLGTISFSLYLLHSFVKDAVDGMGIGSYMAGKLNILFSPIETSILMTLFFYFPLIIILASLTYSTIEKPFLQMRVKYLGDRNETENYTHFVDSALAKVKEPVE